MRSIPSTRFAAPVLGLILCLGLAVVPSSAGAQDSDKKEKKNFSVSPWGNERLTEAQEFLAEEQFAEANAVLERMSKRRSLSDHEQALMWQTWGYVHSSQEQYKRAIDAFEQCLKLDALPDAAALNTQYNLAQLHMAESSFDRAITLLEDWFRKATNPNPAAHYLLAIAHVQKENWNAALPHALKAVADSRRPNESWLQLLLSIHFERGEMAKVGEVLEVLAKNFPKKMYFVQLSQVYFELRQEAKSLAAMEIAYHQGFLDKESEITHLASLYLLREVPYKAARVLEKAFEKGILTEDRRNYEMLANSWLHAREYNKALEPLKKAAAFASDGRLYFQLAQVYLERERWVDAQGALGKALEKGGLPDEGNAHLLMGMTHYNLARYDAATRSFREAARSERQRSTASKWIEHVDRERKRVEAEAAEAAEAEAAAQAAKAFRAEDDGSDTEVSGAAG